MAVADRIDLTNVEGSMTNIIHNNADRLYAAQSVRELHDMLLSIFRENHLDTEASRRLLVRVIEKRTVKQGLDAIFNSYFCGANMSREKEKVGGKPKMFKFDEKLKKIVSEEIEKIEVETEDQEITVETEGDTVKVEIEPKTAECVDCEAPAEETSANVNDYAFFSDLDPEIDIDDIPAEFEDDAVEPAEEGLFKESARGEASEALWDFVETADRDTLVMLCQGFVKWLSEDDCKDFARIYEIPVGDEEDLYEGVNKKYLNALKDKISACYTKQDLEDIGAFIDDLSDKDIDRILNGKVSNKDLNKMFGGYNFVDDDFPGWDFKESKVVKESADHRVKTVEYGPHDNPYDRWYEFERLYLPGKNGKHDVRIYFYEGDDATEDNEDYDVSVDIADESINVDELKLAREIGYAGYYPYLTTFNWDGAVDCCEAIYDYFMELPQEDIYDTLVNKLGCDEEQVSRFFSPNITESKSIREALSVAEFIDWHETTNYKDNENTFEAVYSILDKYQDAEDDVKVQYSSASAEDKEAISRIIDRANETSDEEPTVYLARAMHKMYIDLGYDYQEIADALGCPVSMVLKMIGPDSYDESLTEATEKQYLVIDTQDKDNKDNNRKYTEKQLIDFAKELIKIEEESSEPEQYKNRPELKDDLASVKKVLKYFMYDVKEASEDKLTESVDIDIDEVEDDLYFRGMRGEFGHYEDTVAYRMCDRAEDIFGMDHDDAYELAWKVVSYMADRRFSFEPGEDPEA